MKEVFTMKNIKRTLMTVAVAMLALVSIPATVEAAEKVYKAKAQSTSTYTVGAYSTERLSTPISGGKATFVNGGEVYLSTGKNVTIYYEYKTNATKVSAVKTPTNKSKKIKANKYKTFKITKNTVIKFKVVKGKTTKSTVKKAKTYSLVCNYKKADFVTTKPGVYSVNYGSTASIKLNKGSYDKFTYTVKNTETGKTKTETLKDNRTGFSASITGPTTITVTGYKFDKKLGTYTYKYDVKTYNNPKLSYKLVGNYSDPNFLAVEIKMPYASGFAVSYTTNGSTPSLKNGTFIETLTEDNSTISLTKEGKVTFKAQLYKKVYYKKDGKYVLAYYEPYNGVTTNVYRVSAWAEFRIKTTTENYPDNTNFNDYICPKEWDGLYVTFLDYKGYIRTIFLKPGERVSDCSKYGVVRLYCMTEVVAGMTEYNVKDASYFLQRTNVEDATWMKSKGIAPFTAADYAKSFTDNPTRLTPQQAYSDLQSHVWEWEAKAGTPITKSAYNEETGHYYSVWIDE